MSPGLSPYRGIEPFRYKDADVFFGREIFVEDLVANILAFRLVVLFGESGSGKSSLINAGLIPALGKEGWGLERLRIGASADTPIVVERTPIGENASGGFLPSIFDGLAAGENEPTISLRSGKPRGLSNWRPLVGASWSSISSRSCSHGWRYVRNPVRAASRRPTSSNGS